MANSSSPGSLVWNPDECSGFIATPILPNTTNSRVCGLFTQNETVLRGCCGGDIQTYTCWLYCATDTPFADFSKCIDENAGINGTRNDLFCQSNNTATVKTLASNAFTSASPPSIRLIMLLACLFGFFLTPTSATIIPSLDKSLERRATSSNCSFEEDRRFIRTGNSQRVSSDFSGFESVGVSITSDIERNNRTLNATSAADAQYDAFFDVLSKKFGRQFPAMSSINTFFEFPLEGSGSSVYVVFTPLHWCVNGTATGCKGVLGDTDDASQVEACGPVYVLDNNSTDPQTAETMDGALIQGVLGTVVTA